MIRSILRMCMQINFEARAAAFRLTAICKERRDGADFRSGNRATKERDFAAAPGRGARRATETARRGPTRPLPLPRRPGAELGDQSGEKSLALPGRVPGGRDGDRLGDAGGGGELSVRGGAAPDRAFFFSR